MEIIKKWVPALMWMGLIFYMSSLQTRPHTPGLEDFRYDDKLQHAAAYAVLCMFLWWPLMQYYPRKKVAYIAAIVAIIYAFSDEMHQIFVPTRECQVSDIIADSMGAVISSFLLYKITGGDGHDRKTEKRKNQAKS